MNMSVYPQYDFVIFGESPIALWAGLTLLKAGKRVIVFPMGTEGSFEGVPRVVAEDFGLDRKDYPNRKKDPIQIIYTNHRFRVGETREEFSQECRFHLGHELNPIEPLSGELVRGLEFLATGVDPVEAPSDSWSKVFDRVGQTLYFDQKRGWLTQQLLSCLQERGATVCAVRDLAHIFVEKGGLVGVQLLGSSKAISVKEAFVGIDWYSLEKKMSEKKSLRTMPVRWTYDIQFEIAEESIPIGLTSRMIVVERGAPLLQLFHRGAGRFILRSSLPFQEDSLDRGIQRKMALRMLKVCEKLIPDLNYNLKAVYPDLRNPEKAENQDLPELFPFQALSEIPVSLYRYDGGRSGIGKKAPYKGFYIASPEADPASGWIGALSATQKHLEAIFTRNVKK